MKGKVLNLILEYELDDDKLEKIMNELILFLVSKGIKNVEIGPFDVKSLK